MRRPFLRRASIADAKDFVNMNTHEHYGKELGGCGVPVCGGYGPHGPLDVQRRRREPHLNPDAPAPLEPGLPEAVKLFSESAGAIHTDGDFRANPKVSV